MFYNRDIVLTRYLYNKNEVKISLLLSLLDIDSKESMFWAYELYFSGFQYEVLEYLLKIYEEIYESKNKRLRNFILENIEKWKNDNTQHYILGSIVMTMTKRQYDITPFIISHFKIKCHQVENKPQNSKPILVYLTEKDIGTYNTIDITGYGAWKILRNTILYPIRKEINRLFNIIPVYNIDIIYSKMDNWIYYAAKSPIWNDRIKEFDGIINNETKTVDFKNDYLMDAFSDKWNYDMDEQPGELKDYIYRGIPLVKELSLNEFAMIYGVNVLIRKVKIIESFDTKELTNSLTCM